jgi:hypothetical protein
VLNDRLTIAGYLDKNVENEPAIRKARIMADRSEPLIELEELQAFVKEFGFKPIHFCRVLNELPSLQKKTNCEQIANLIKGLHDARPAAFRKYFLEHLELSATHSQLVDLYIGGLDATCERWYYAILKPLIEHPETRDRALAAIEKIIKFLPPEKKPFLEELWKDYAR